MLWDTPPPFYPYLPPSLSFCLMSCFGAEQRQLALEGYAVVRRR
jgi:hypothetical protein